MKNPEVDILGQVFPVFAYWNHFENNLGNKIFGIFYNDPKCPAVTAQNPVNQLLIPGVISNGIVHLLDQTGKLE